ncbi:hypothetical protein BC938DRAFT_479497, partial [Jimgerdemannia flammicorona]
MYIFMVDMEFSRCVDDFLAKTNVEHWNVLNYLQYLEDQIPFSSDSKDDIIDAFKQRVEYVSRCDFMGYGAKTKAAKLYKNVENTFQRKEILEVFEKADQKFEKRKNDREIHNSVDVAKVAIAKTATTRLVK